MADTPSAPARPPAGPPVVVRATAPAAVSSTAAAGGPADAPKPFTLLAYTGAALRVAGFDHEVVIDLAGFRADRPDRPVLREHDPGRIVGHTTGVAVTPRGVEVAGVLSGVGPDADEVRRLAGRGYPWQVSVGASADRVEYVPAGATAAVNGRPHPGPLSVARRSTLREVSFVSLGADGATRAAVAATARVGEMTFESWCQARGFDPAGLSEPQTAHLRAGYDAEQGGGGQPVSAAADLAAARTEGERRRQITDIAARHAVQNPDRADEFERAAGRAVAAGRTTQEAELELLRLSYGRGPNVVTPDVVSGYAGYAGSGGGQGVRHLAAAVAVRAGRERAAERAFGPGVMNRLGRLRSASLPDLCRAALAMDGREVPDDRGSVIRAALSTGTLPSAIGEAGRVALEDAFRESAPSWAGWCAVRPAADFKPHKTVRPTFAGPLEPVAPGGDIRHTVVGSADAIAWQVQTFGKMVGLDRTDVINDDLGVVAEVIPALARMAARSLSDLVYAALLANPGGHFAAANGNVVAGGGSALGVAGLAAAVRALRTQRDADGTDLDIRPAVLLVPPELETTARQLLSSEALARDGTSDQQPTGNPFAGGVALAVEPRLSNPRFTGGSGTAWYLFAGPADVPGVVGFLDGRQTPTLESFGLDAEPAKLQVSYRVYWDYGFALGDPKAGVRAAGA